MELTTGVWILIAVVVTAIVCMGVTALRELNRRDKLVDKEGEWHE